MNLSCPTCQSKDAKIYSKTEVRCENCGNYYSVKGCTYRDYMIEICRYHLNKSNVSAYETFMNIVFNLTMVDNRILSKGTKIQSANYFSINTILSYVNDDNPTIRKSSRKIIRNVMKRRLYHTRDELQRKEDERRQKSTKEIVKNILTE